MAQPPPPPPVDIELSTVLDDNEPDGTGFICPECGERFGSPAGLGKHRQAKHDVAGRKPQPGRTSRKVSQAKGAEINRMRRDLKKSVSALLLIPFMAKGTAGNLTDPRVTLLLDEKAEAFADAWVAVAEQNDIVRQNLSRLLQSGVWLNAAAQTAALGYVVAVFSGVTPMHPGAMMLMPEMAQFFPPPQQQPQQSPNGGEPHE
jgi:hypothetical protein